MFLNAIISYGSSFWETAATQNCGHTQGISLTSLFSIIIIIVHYSICLNNFNSLHFLHYMQFCIILSLELFSLYYLQSLLPIKSFE